MTSVVALLLSIPAMSPASDLANSAVRLLSEQDKYITTEVLSESAEVSIFGLIASVIVLLGLVGLSVGAAGGWRQAGASAVKVPILLLSTFVICLPVMIVGNLMTGAGLSPTEVIRLVLLGLTTQALILTSLAPIILFFGLQSRYDFMKLLIVAAFALSAVVSMSGLLDAMIQLTLAKGVISTDPVWLFKLWVIAFGFVGMQMAWAIRPIIGSPDLQFEWLRPANLGGNFYTAVLESIRRMMEGESPSPFPPE